MNIITDSPTCGATSGKLLSASFVLVVLAHLSGCVGGTFDERRTEPPSPMLTLSGGSMKVDSCYVEALSDREPIQRCDMTFTRPGVTFNVVMTSESSNWEQHLFDKFQSCQEQGRVAKGKSNLNFIQHDRGRLGFSHSTSPAKCVRSN